MWRRSLVLVAGAGTAALYVKGRRPYQRKQNFSAGPPPRNEMVSRLKKEPFDVLIVGAGATGSSVALECATRGISCCLVDRGDLSSETSSKSTKLLHGGVRYLEAAVKNRDPKQLSLVCEALEERAHIMEAASYMTRPIPILLPVYSWWELPYAWAGLKAYGLLAAFVTLGRTGGIPRSIYVGPEMAKSLFPLLRPENLKGALVYFDGQQNDARMNLQIARTAATPALFDEDGTTAFKPAVVANYCQVVSLLKDDQRRVIGAVVKDLITDEQFEVLARVVVNATGPGSDMVRQMADPKAQKRTVTSSGTHIVLPKEYAPHGAGLLVSRTSDNRVLFVLPWQGRVVVGTTDNATDFTYNPKPTNEDIDFICSEAARILGVNKKMVRSHVKSAWTGLRPLVLNTGTSSAQTGQLVRSHCIVEDKGLVSIMGGKWTTARRMASDTVDHLIRTGVVQGTPSRTKGLRLRGSAKFGGKGWPVLCSRYSLTSSQGEHLWQSYGAEADLVCQVGERTGTLKQLSPGFPFLEAEVIYAARHEWAQRAVDVLFRRIPLASLDMQAAIAAIPRIVELLGTELNWSSNRRSEETRLALDHCKTLNA